MEQATQVSPTVEEKMNMFRSLFNDFADTIVSASGLKAEIDEMRSQLNALRFDNDTLRVRNRELDEQVGEVRRQRDVAQAEAEALRERIRELESNASYGQVAVEGLRRDLSAAQEEIVSLKRSKEDYFKAFEDADGKLGKAMDWISEVTRLFQNPPVV